MQSYGQGEKKKPADTAEVDQTNDWLTGDSNWNSEGWGDGNDKKDTSAPAVLSVQDEKGRLLMDDGDLIDWNEADDWGSSWSSTAPTKTKKKAGKPSKSD